VSDGVIEDRHADLVAVPIRLGSRSRVTVTRAEVTMKAQAAGAAP
jgi:hypothetical protein